MKKILSLVLAALMIFSVLPVAFADEAVVTEETTEAPAVEEVSEYQAAIDFLKLLDIYKGDGAGDAAAELVTRWQMALFTSRFITGQVDAAYWATEENDSGFTDVEEFEGASEEALGAISFASQKGIVNGVGEGLFDPETGVQYREAITMIVRALGYTYKASGYPWSYINKAREIGLLDGISGISYTQQINREVVAQLLYNALFVENNGSNVAESVFGVGNTVVLITASNKVAYLANDSKVTRSNYVRFQELDAQGEPTAPAYHVSYDKFGLENGALAADAAVGTAYAVTYKNGCADILAAESLSKVYENRGTELPVSQKDNKYLIIDGSQYQMVTSYNSLNKDQGWNKDSAGTAQVKLYYSFGAKVVGTNSKYYVDSLKNVWEADPTAMGGYKLYAQYSTVLGKYYRLNGEAWEIVDLDKLLAGASVATAGFEKAEKLTNTKLAYADFTVTDASNDGYADRVTVKQYGFGQITYDKRKNKDNKDQETFIIRAVAANGDSGVTTNVVKTDVVSKTYNDSNNGKEVTGYPFTTSFRWTGMARADVAKNAYVLYYVDEANREVDILKVVDTDAADGVYTVSGYLRGYDAANDTIYLDSIDGAYTIGHDTLKGSPILTKNANDKKNISNNVKTIQPMVNTYVTLVIVDNKVVMVNDAGKKADYVIIDSFVAFEEDGIVANAWTTVDDAYTQIKISELNGWTVGGFDYYLYFLSGMFDKNNEYSKLIPIKTKTVYQVVYVKDDVYNLTGVAVNPAAGENLTLNQYGYIVGTKADGTLGAQYYTTTNANDYWLILDTKGNVITFDGVLNPVVVINGDIIKSKENDYVVVVTDVNDKNCIDGLNKLSGKVTQYMLYNDLVNQLENSNLNFGTNNLYEWTILMQDVMTREWKLVTIDPKLVPMGYLGWKLADIGVNDGDIYAVVDGKLSNVTTYTFADVCASYSDNGVYEAADSISFMGGTKDVDTLDEIKWLVADDVIENIRNKWMITSTGDTAELRKEFGKKVTLIGMSGVSLTTDVHKLVTNPEARYTINYVYTKDGTAIGWLNENPDWQVNKAYDTPATATKMGTITDGVFAGGEAWNGLVATNFSYSPADSYFYSRIVLPATDKFGFNNYDAYVAAEKSMKVDVVFADGTKATYTPATQGNVGAGDGICIKMPTEYGDMANWNNYAESGEFIINFVFDLQAHGFVKSYTLTIDKGAGLAAQINVVRP